MNRTSDTEFHTSPCEVISNVVCVPYGAGEPVQFGHHEGVSGAACGQSFTETWPVSVAARQAMIYIDPFRLYTQGRKRIPLCC